MAIILAVLMLNFTEPSLRLSKKILIDELNYYGIRGLANNWLELYLENRKHFFP